MTSDNIMAYLFTEYADLYFRKANQMQKKTGGTLTLKNLTKYALCICLHAHTSDTQSRNTRSRTQMHTLFSKCRKKTGSTLTLKPLNKVCALHMFYTQYRAHMHNYATHICAKHTPLHTYSTNTKEGHRHPHTLTKYAHVSIKTHLYIFRTLETLYKRTRIGISFFAKMMCLSVPV